MADSSLFALGSGIPTEHGPTERPDEVVRGQQCLIGHIERRHSPGYNLERPKGFRDCCDRSYLTHLFTIIP